MPANRSKPTRERRHNEAVARDQARAKRSTADQLALIAKRPGESRKERARLGAS